MAKIVPFQCIRPAQGYEKRVAALPYDVYSREEAAEAAAGDPLSFLNIDRPETQFPPWQDMYAPEVYAKADELLQQRISEGIFKKDRERGYDVYEQILNGRTQTGLVACASIDDYIGGVIRKHENTRADKEADRIRHVDACSAQTSPIFLAYRKHPVIEAVITEVKREMPLFEFRTEDGVNHRGWHIADPEKIEAIRAAFEEIGRIYIADGHHRAASAVQVGLNRRRKYPDYDGSEEFNYFLTVLFPDEELQIMDYNRVVKDLNGLTEEEFLMRAAEIFEIMPGSAENVGTAGGNGRETGCSPKKKEEGAGDRGENISGTSAIGQKAGEHGKGLTCGPREKGELKMYLGNTWYDLRIRPQFRSFDPVEDLDVSILQKQFLAPVLGIRDLKNDRRIGFVGGVRGLGELERRVHTDCAAAFAMYPTSIQELFAVADAGRLMPPKSTWFEPKLRSGLYIHAFER